MADEQQTLSRDEVRTMIEAARERLDTRRAERAHEKSAAAERWHQRLAAREEVVMEKAEHSYGS